MKIYFLLIGTTLSLIPSLSSAQCVATQDCETLGYTETSCNGGNGVKCPFGNKWACLKSDADYEQEFCSKYGFTQTCTGTGYTGGISNTCNGKYNVCSCAKNYIWKDGYCKLLNGADGDVYRCNGEVVAIKAPNMNFYVALTDLSPSTMNYNDASIKSDNAFCKSGLIPNNNQWMNIHDNLSTINDLLIKNGGTQLTTYAYWSSSMDEYNANHVVVYVYYADVQHSRGDSNKFRARAIIR